MKPLEDVAVLRGEEELFARAGHLFTGATEFACAANDMHTWAVARSRVRIPPPASRPKLVRKLYRPAMLLDPALSQHLRELEREGAQIRITPDEINETIIIDRRLAILAGGFAGQDRTYSVITRPEVVNSVTSLFDSAYRGGTELAVYDRRFAELRSLAPRILELLSSGCKDETAARTLGLGLRTYRRRVAELMAALGATSRFQAGVRARELGLV
ncbi:DNA-binding response regulator [Amycolatopsis minnesotensis]|uniref:DNA-binding response regulator n=1 Tax=Amycolatopsis minnesotensis TaxID=337894 RepID=UPI0031D8359B